MPAMNTATRIIKSVEPALAEWERLKQRALKLENEAALKLDPLYERMATLEATIGARLKVGISADGETVAVSQVDCGGAVAEVKDNGCREISAEDFLRAVPTAKRNATFYSCLKVLISPTDKFLPAAVVKKLAKFKHKHSVNVRLKK